MSKRWCWSVRLTGAVAVALAASTATGLAQGAEEFYKGKQLRFIIHSEPGGDYDQWGRAVIKFMASHIPGNPTIVPQNMPGAGGFIAANWLYGQAPRDGTTFAIIGRNLPFQALVGEAGAKYDPVKFNWLGSPELTNRVCAVMAGAPVKTAAEVFEKEVLMGGAGPGTAVNTVPLLLNRLLGTRFKLIEGYRSSTGVQLAMERGEVHGICQSVSSLLRSRPGWYEQGKWILLFNLERNQIPGMKEIPTIWQFAKTEEQRRILGLFTSSVEFGRPFVMPPEVPADRVALMRRAFAATIRDPGFLAEAQKMSFEVALVPGEELETMIKDMMSTPREFVDKMNAMIK